MKREVKASVEKLADLGQKREQVISVVRQEHEVIGIANVVRGFQLVLYVVVK